MKVKYYSEDGHEFDTKHQCAKYEKELKELETLLSENKDKDYKDLIEHVELGGNTWYKINNNKDFFLFDHKDDIDDSKKSSKSFYDIFKISLNMSSNFPIWISNYDGVFTTDKKLIEETRAYINQLKILMDEKREEIKKIKSLDELLKEEPIPKEKETDVNIEKESPEKTEVEKGEDEPSEEFNDD